MTIRRGGNALIIAALAGTSMVALNGTAVAQQDEAREGLEEIMVTARKRAESLQDAPIAITAFTAENLDARGLNDLSEIGNHTPNLVFDFTSQINPTSSAASIYIRGIGQADWTLPSDPGVGLYVDGVYVARSVGGVLDLLEVETVEVLKGPQGTLFGRNTIGGAISITTRKPGDEYEGKVSVAGGKFNRINVRGYLNIPVSETFAFSIAGSRKKANGYVKNLIPGAPDLGDEDVWAGRVAARWNPSDRLEVNISVDATRERENNAPNVHPKVFEDSFLGAVYNGVDLGFPFPDELRPNFIPDPVCSDFSDPSRLNNSTCFNNFYAVDFSDNPYLTSATFVSNVDVVNQLGSRPAEAAADLDLFGISMTIDYDISDTIQLTSISAYREVDGFWVRDEDGTPIEIVSTVNDFTQDQFTQELQLKEQTQDGRMNWLIGGFYFTEDGCHLDLVYLYIEALTSGGCIDAESYAAFGQATYDVTDQLSATFGIRYTDDDKTYTADSISLLSGFFGFPFGTRILPTEPQGNPNDEVDFHGSLAYRWTEDFMTYASYSESFKGVTFTQRVFPPRPDVPTASSESAQSYEIGFKSSLADNRVRLNAAAFYTDYTDIQVNVLEPGSAGDTVQNAAGGEIKGFEIELTAVPNPQWLIEGGIGYLDAKYTNVDPIATQITTDSRFVNTPEFSANLGIAYTAEIANGWTATPRVDYSYISKIFNDGLNTTALIQPGVSLIDASLRFINEDNGWTLALEGHNLTDKLVRVSGFSDPFFTGNTEITVAPPRTWLIKAEYAF